jgi:23S rRNA (uridine2552-2'-O)-methyltransferase
VDLGCWPGGWVQVAAKEVGPRGMVVGFDLAEIEPPMTEENVATFVGDLEDPSICERVLSTLGGRADVLLSDAAPKLTGIRTVDRANEERLLEAVDAMIPLLLRPGGDFLAKILEGPEAQLVDRRIRGHFTTAKTVKTKATRKGSRERYVLARDYRGPAREEDAL